MAGHSRHRHRGHRGFTSGLSTILRAMIGRAPPRGYSASERPVHHVSRPWFVRKKFSVPHLSIFVALTCGLIWIAWHIVSDTVAFDLATSSPETALRWRASEPAALTQLALNELRNPDGDLDVARDWAQRALLANPLDDQALLLLGIIAERKSDDKRADLLARMAGERTWRNPATQLWLFQRAIHQRDYRRAMEHADAVLRPNLLNPKFFDLIFPTLTTFTTYPPSFQALADFLKNASPPWRAEFLMYLSHKAPSRAQLDKLYSMLINSKQPPTNEELRPYINALVQDARYAQAYQVWYNALPVAQRADKREPYNGDFVYPVDDLPFNWVLTSQPGADIDIVTLKGNRERALRVQFSGARVNFANVRHLLLLQPGHYIFTGKVRADDFQAARGLRWHIFCAGGAAKDLVHTDLIAQNVPWTDFGNEFDVADSCKAQWLQLELPARIASEKEIAGQIWYQSLRIARLSDGPKPGP